MEMSRLGKNQVTEKLENKKSSWKTIVEQALPRLFFIIWLTLTIPASPFLAEFVSFSSKKVRISIREAEGLPSSPVSRIHWPVGADVWGPKPRAVNQPQPPAASGSSARIVDVSSLSARFHPTARTRYSICMRSARQSSGDSSCHGSTPTKPPSADAGQLRRWPGLGACAVPVQ